MSPKYEQLDLPDFDSENNDEKESDLENNSTTDTEDNQKEEGEVAPKKEEIKKDDSMQSLADRLYELEKDDTAYDDLHGRKMR